MAHNSPMANFHFVTAQRSGVEFIRQRRKSSPRYEEIPQMRDFQFMFTVYIIQSEEGYVYVGQTNDMDRRLREHNSGHSCWTKRGNNWVLLYQENYETRVGAVRRERYFKTGIGRKWIYEVVLKYGS